MMNLKTRLLLPVLGLMLGCSPDAKDVVPPPDMPEQLSAAATNASVELSWSSATGATSYNIYWVRADGGGDEPAMHIEANNKDTHFLHSSLENGKTYRYAVSSAGPGGESARSTFISATPIAPPATPGGITVHALPDGGVEIIWSTVDSADRYTLCASATTPVESCTQYKTQINNQYEGDLFSGEVYYFTLVATNKGGESEPSPVYSTILPPATMTATPGNGTVTVDWPAVSGADYYNLYWADEPGIPRPDDLSLIRVENTTTVSYPETLINDTTYYFRVTAGINGVNESGLSIEHSATPLAPPDKPLSIQANPRDETVTLNWTDVEYATRYTIYQSTDAGISPNNYGKKYTTANNENLFVVADLLSETDYYFVVTAVNAIGGEGPPSATVSGRPVKQFGAAGGRNHFCAVKGGVLWCWDDYDQYMIKIQTVSPIAIEGGSAVWSNIIEAGDFHTCAVKKDLSLWCWGRNYSGQLGLGSTTSETLPQQVGAGKWRALALGLDHSCGIQEDKTLWCWGSNNYGQIGVDDRETFRFNSPVQVGSDADWDKISSEYFHNCAIKTSGSLWCWGRNLRGQINSSGSVLIYSPVMVGDSETPWLGIALGYDHTCALKWDEASGSNTAWCWGRNSGGRPGGGGELGDGTGIDSSTPVQVVGQYNELITGWKSIAVGDDHACAIRSDKSLWAWGQNYYGHAGDSSNIDKLFPERYTEDNDWEAVAASNAGCCAVKSDETFWCWNANQSPPPVEINFSQ